MVSNIKVSRLVVDKPGARLDKYVSQQCPELSRTQAQKLITDGYIRVNDRPAKAGLKLDTGDKVTITIPPPAPSSLLPEAIPLNILYEDADLLVIDKPAGLAVHPAPGHPSHTLVNAILSHFSSLPDTGSPPLLHSDALRGDSVEPESERVATGGDWLRPGIVHRLDKDTSGLMLVAKNSPAHSNLADQFKARSVVKAYLVLVKGQLTPPDGAIEAPIGRDPRNRKRMAVVAEGHGRPARTQYHVIKYIGNHSLLEVRPETGRTHQIRVHLAAIGYPVAGDKVYGVKSAQLSRQFLHAARLGFHLPATGEYVEFESDLPPDLAQALKDIA